MAPWRLHVGPGGGEAAVPLLALFIAVTGSPMREWGLPNQDEDVKRGLNRALVVREGGGAQGIL